METLDARSPAPPGAGVVAALFQERYAEMVRLAGLLGADDAEDVAQEAIFREDHREVLMALATPPAGMTWWPTVRDRLHRTRRRRGVTR